MKIRTVLLLLPFLFVGSCTILALKGCYQTDAAVGLPRHTRWEAEFIDVSFSESYNTINFEGSISLSGFLDLMERYDWNVEEIPPEGIEIVRFSRVLRWDYENSQARGEDPRYPSVPLPPEDEDLITIRNGLWSDELQNDGGGHTIAYDSETGRAYIRVSLR